MKRKIRAERLPRLVQGHRRANSITNDLLLELELNAFLYHVWNDCSFAKSAKCHTLSADIESNPDANP